MLDSERCFLPNPIGVSIAQGTPVLHLDNFLLESEIEALREYGDGIIGAHGTAACKHGIEVRSGGGDDAWKVAFLNTEDRHSADGFEWILDRLKKRLKSLDGWNGLVNTDEYDGLNTRVIEYHRQTAPGPGINDPKHYDMDSVVTIDIALSKPEEFEGGEFGTLESTGQLRHHKFSRGDAVAFISHKFHCVSKVETGIRRVLVVELWRGPPRTCPHRCEHLGKSCKLEKSHVPNGQGGDAVLPFRLGGVEFNPEGAELLWQSSEETVKVAPKAIEADEDDEEWDLFG